MDGIVTFEFKGGTGDSGGRGGRDPFGFGGSCAVCEGLTSVFPTIFSLYLNYLLFEASSSTSSVSSLQ